MAQRKDKPIYFPRGQQHKFQSQIATEEEEWDSRMRSKKENENGKAVPNNGNGNGLERANTFEEFRCKNKAAGVI